MEGILAIIMIFGMPVFLLGIRKHFQLKEKQLEFKQKGLAGPEREQLEELRQERAQLQERVENLETIVCSVDLELNAKLNRLASQQSFLQLPAPQSVGGEIGGTTAQQPASAVAAPVNSPAPSPFSAPPSIGSLLLDRFLIEEEIGHGGMGIVYVATDKELGERVALKVITRTMADDPQMAERFRREASAARKITHPNVIRIHDLGDHHGLLFLSMEFFSGRSLSDLLNRRQKLPLNETKGIISQVADALDAAHAAGVIHRDLKPQNILVSDARDVRVIDFGLAKATYLPGMSATGLIMGTPEYMSPEQVRGGTVDQRSDIYSLGAVVYQMLTGQPPFIAETPIAVGFLHCSETPRSLMEISSGIPQTVEDVVLKALAKEPSQRFDRAADFKAALRNA